jgi:hypothetical protein
VVHQRTLMALHRLRFLVLMLGAPGPPAPLFRGPAIDVFYVDGARSRISVIVSQGVTIDAF